MDRSSLCLKSICGAIASSRFRALAEAHASQSASWAVRPSAASACTVLRACSQLNLIQITSIAGGADHIAGCPSFGGQRTRPLCRADLAAGATQGQRPAVRRAYCAWGSKPASRKHRFAIERLTMQTMREQVTSIHPELAAGGA
jgi:hypothetical protein